MSQPSPLRRVATATLAGAALGALEMSLRLLSGPDPSVARRLLPLLFYGACVSGAVPLLAAAAASLAARVRGIPATAAMTGALAGVALATALVTISGHFFWRSGTMVRWGALQGSAAASVLLWWAVARWLSSGRGARVSAFLERLFRPGRVAAVSLFVLLLAAVIGFWRMKGLTEPSVSQAAPAGRDGRPDIILVLVDTLRADSVSALGGPPGSTPTVDALAARGVRFSHAVAPSPWTLPSVASLMTATDPRTNGFGDFSSAIPDSAVTLPEHLSAAGYQCLAIV